MANSPVLSSNSISSTIWHGMETCINNIARIPIASIKDLGRVVLIGAIVTTGAVFAGRNAVREISLKGFTSHSQDLGLLSLALFTSSCLSAYLAYARFCAKEVEENEELFDFLGGPPITETEVSGEESFDVENDADYAQEDFEVESDEE